MFATPADCEEERRVEILEDEQSGEDPEEDSAIDRGHASIERGFLDFVDAVDRFFVDENYEETTRESFLLLAPGIRIREGPNLSFKPRLRASFALPNTKRRLGLVIAGESDDDDRLEGGGRDDEGNSLNVGLRAALFDDPRTKLRLSAGSKFRPQPDPFVRLLLMRIAFVGDLIVRPSVAPFWELDDGFGERTRLDLDYAVTRYSLMRLRNDAEYSQSTDGVEFTSSLFYFFTLRERSGWRLRLRTRWQTRPVTAVTEYKASARYRWSMLRKWLFFEVEPGVRFRREDDWNAEPEVILRIEFAFGALRKKRYVPTMIQREPAPQPPPSTQSGSEWLRPQARLGARHGGRP